MSDDKSDDTDAAYTCIDCGQEFESLTELAKHESKHQNLSRTDRLP
jgi:LYAR-type C2HC zinc finger protein